MGILGHAMPKYIHHRVNHGKEKRSRIMSHTRVMDMVIYKDKVSHQSPHPCTRGIKLGNDVLRTPAFLRIENYIFHTPDFFQRRDRLFSYPRGKTPMPTPLLLSAEHDMNAGSRSWHHEPSGVASSQFFLRRGVDVFALKKKSIYNIKIAHRVLCLMCRACRLFP